MIVVFMDERAGKVKAQNFETKEAALKVALDLTTMYPDANFEKVEIDTEIAFIDMNSSSSICVVEEGGIV